MLEADLSKLHETPKAEVRPIWEVMLDNVEGISPEEFQRFPATAPVSTITICMAIPKVTNDRSLR